MIIDTNPIIDTALNSFTVEFNIDTSEEISISINGIIALLKEDFLTVYDNVIIINYDEDIDFDNDSFVVFYDKL